MSQLADGTVIPSYLGTDDGQDFTALLFEDVSVKLGEVTQIVYPDDSLSISQKRIEYIVMVQRRDGNGAWVNVPYRCTIAPGFGGVADYINYTLRQQSADKQAAQQPEPVTDGCQVLVACVNGETNKALIIAGGPHPDGADDPKREAGHFYRFRFNGVAIEIDKDGAYTLTVPGATKVDGQPIDDPDPNNKGSYIKLAKDGTITVSDARDVENGKFEQVTISPKDQKITIHAGAVSEQVEKTWTVVAKEGCRVETDKDVVIQAGGQIKIGSDGATENLVLGNQLAAALKALVQIFVSNAPMLSQTGNLGYPVPLNPAIVSALTQWLGQYVSSKRILSDSRFTEK